MFECRLGCRLFELLVVGGWVIYMNFFLVWFLVLFIETLCVDWFELSICWCVCVLCL